MAGPSPSPPPSPAQVLNDRYEVVRPLGHGGMGAVYLVFDRQEGRQVALKSFPPSGRRVEDLAHFEHEFQTLAPLRHPNVAEVYDFGEVEGTNDVFFTSEVIAGKDLFEFSQGLPERDLARLVVQVCRGLSYIHSREIIHYDVKPTNILVATGGATPVAKIIDFGLAAQKVDDAIGVIKGTVSYLAPELARHLPVDHRADLYSLGVTLFHCLTRQLPFRGETNLDVVRKVVSDSPPDPLEACPTLSRGLRDLVLRLMAKDPGARPQSGNEVIRALSKLYGEDFATEPRHAAVTFVVSGGFVGRDGPYRQLTGAFDAIFARPGASSDEGPVVSPTDSPRRGSTSSIAASGFVITSSAGSLDAALMDSSARFQSGYSPTSSSGGEAADALDPTKAPPSPAAEPAVEQEPRPLVHVVLVGGEAGVGKSRLLRELKTHAQLRRAAVVEGRAAASGSPYAAFVEVFRGMLGLWPDERGRPEAATTAGREVREEPRQTDPLRRRLLGRYGAELVRLIPDLDSGAVPLAQRAALAPEQDEVRLLDALAQFLIGYGRSRPLVVLLHDLERADPATLELLRYVARNLAVIERTRLLAARVVPGRGPRREPPPPVRLLVVGTYRPTEVEGRPVQRVLEALQAEPVVSALPLAPLGPDEVAALVESMLGVGNAPAGLAERIWRETSGNPFFAVELMRSLVEAGALVREDGRWRLTRPDAVRVPDRVAEVILERARRIADEDRGPIELLAVLGRPAGVPELQALLGGDARDLVARLAALERRQVLRADDGHPGGRRWEFVHEVAREAVYEAIAPDQRIALHGRCGELLEQRAALGTADTGELVRHFGAAGDRKRALEYGIRAGDDARAVHANHRAVAFYEGALALLPAGAARWRSLLATTGDLLEHTGDYDRAAAVYGRLLAHDVARALSPEEAVRAHRRRGEVLERKGDFDGALDALSAGAAAALAVDGLEREGAALLAATASIYGRTGRYEDALGFCEAALAQLAGLPEEEAAALVHSVRGRARSALGDMAAAERDLEHALAIRRRLGDEAGVARALADLGVVALETGRLEEASNRFERALERETALGHSAGMAEAAARLAQACRGLGELERAASLLRRALSIHEKSGARAEAVTTLVELGRLMAGAGDPGEALDALRRARTDALAQGLLAVAARAHNAEAGLVLRLGHDVRARELATEALRLASLHGDVPRERASALENLGLAHAAGGDSEAAEHLLYQAQALFRAQKDPAGVARTTLAVVDLLVARGDGELARAALEGLEQEPPPAEERAHHLVVRARAALALDPGPPQRATLTDLQRASELADEARDRELGWQIDWLTGRALERQGDLRGALAALVDAMSALRDLMERVPAELRGTYVRSPSRVACREDFLRFKARGAGA